MENQVFSFPIENRAEAIQLRVLERFFSLHFCGFFFLSGWWEKFPLRFTIFDKKNCSGVHGVWGKWGKGQGLDNLSVIIRCFFFFFASSTWCVVDYREFAVLLCSAVSFCLYTDATQTALFKNKAIKIIEIFIFNWEFELFRLPLRVL